MSLKQLSRLFEEALAFKQPERRRQFVNERCGDDEHLRDELHGLLDSHTRGHQLLDGSTQLLSLVEDGSGQEREGTIVGNYKLLQKIGEGGIGRVFMAEQLQPIRRKVAIKIIKAGMDSKPVIARFEAEREALARLDHPNVTRIFDAGTTGSGRPFFAMELVRGSSITDYCKQHRVGIEKRVALMEQVCHVIHHAHQKGIVHRDVKPSNVMVTIHDGVPVPKVIDFGIAKALDRPLTEKTLFTRYGDLIGTPAYMSPEQAEMSGLDLDVRTDIYSLGVILYELLTGTTPITSESIRDQGLLKVFETIRDSEAETPSLRVTRIMASNDHITQQLKSTPVILKRCLAGELDWITMRAIAKDRNERYESAAAMANDLRRYLDGEPVDAAAPAFAYRSRKFVRKYRGICIAVLLGVILLLASTAVSAYLAISFSAGEREAQRTSDNLAQKSEELETAKAEVEAALARAKVAEKTASDLARQKRNEAAITRALTRFHNERLQVKLATVLNNRLAPNSPETRTHTSKLEQDGAKSTSPSMVGKDEFPLVHTKKVLSTIQIELSETTFVIKIPSAIKVGEFRIGPTQIAERARAAGPEGARLFEILLEEQRSDFGNEDLFVAETLMEFGNFLIHTNQAEKLIVAENHFRDALAIQDSSPDAKLDRIETMICLGRVLALQGKSFQSDGVLREADQQLQLVRPEELQDDALEQIANLTEALATARETELHSSEE